jgi:putative tRNA adenosine deaminase-associated protein
MAVDFGLIAWHEDGRWTTSGIADTRDIGVIIDSLKAQQTNGGAIAMIAIEDEFVIIARMLGDQMRMMISDVTYALDYDVAAELVEVMDLDFPEEEDEPSPAGDLDPELYPDEALEAIANRLGFGDQLNKLAEFNN